MSTIRDIALFIVSFGLPLYFVIRFGWRGVVVGAICMWVIVYASGAIQRASDPQAERFGMGMWLVIGLPFTVIYCDAAYGVRQFILYARTRLCSLDGKRRDGK